MYCWSSSNRLCMSCMFASGVRENKTDWCPKSLHSYSQKNIFFELHIEKFVNIKIIFLCSRWDCVSYSSHRTDVTFRMSEVVKMISYFTSNAYTKIWTIQFRELNSIKIYIGMYQIHGKLNNDKIISEIQNFTCINLLRFFVLQSCNDWRSS